MPIAAETGVVVGFQDVTFDPEGGQSGRDGDRAKDEPENAMAESGI
jgi:hypothetical protein